MPSDNDFPDLPEPSSVDLATHRAALKTEMAARFKEKKRRNMSVLSMTVIGFLLALVIIVMDTCIVPMILP